MDSIIVHVPATSANLACGFDTLGVALSVYNSFRFTLAESFAINGADKCYCNKKNLAYLGFAAVYMCADIPVPEIQLDISADIPIARGLGSSAAMIAGGALAANHFLGDRYSRTELLAIVTPIEGHPDNLAPALLGGLVASSVQGDSVHTAAYKVHESLRFAVLSPDFTLSTSLARQALPESVSFADACYNLPRLALLPHAMETGDIKLISFCLDDRLHQPYRIKLIDDYELIRSIANSLGCRSVCISGAGPSILCISDDETFALRMSAAVPELWTLRELTVDNNGGLVEINS